MSVLLKCKKHPQYQAKRKPKASCAACKMLWELTLERMSDPCVLSSSRLHLAFQDVVVAS